jgi:hypothetical protein
MRFLHGCCLAHRRLSSHLSSLRNASTFGKLVLSTGSSEGDARRARSERRSPPASPAARLRIPEVHVAALVGVIAGAMSHHSLAALVRAPALAIGATAALFAAALLKGRDTLNGRDSSDRYLRLVCTTLSVGFIAGWTLPGNAPAPWRSVVTRAGPHSSRDDLFDALDALDARPDTLLGRHISVTGVWHPHEGDNLATVSQRVMACCAADAVDVGFDVLPSGRVVLAPGTRVRVGGTVTQALRQGETRYVLRDANVTRVNGESIGAR